MENIFKAMVIFGIWLYFKNSIHIFGPKMELLVLLFGIGILIYLILPAVIPHFFKRCQNDDYSHFIREMPDKPVKEAQSQSHYQMQSLLKQDQIEKFNQLRLKISLDDAKKFPVIRISGNYMDNLAPDSGIFTV